MCGKEKRKICRRHWEDEKQNMDEDRLNAKSMRYPMSDVFMSSR